MAKLTEDDVRCEADPDDDDVTVEYERVKYVTKKAVLLRVEGDEHWLPFSQLVDFDKKTQEVVVTAFIARAKGFS